LFLNLGSEWLSCVVLTKAMGWTSYLTPTYESERYILKHGEQMDKKTCNLAKSSRHLYRTIYLLSVYVHLHAIPNASFSSHRPAENEITAHFPLQAHFLAPLSPPPPSVARSFSSNPGFKPTTTSALQVRKERILTPDPGPMGPMAVVNGVFGSHNACPC
jgi:hypothetical protein